MTSRASIDRKRKANLKIYPPLPLQTKKTSGIDFFYLLFFTGHHKTKIA